MTPRLLPRSLTGQMLLAVAAALLLAQVVGALLVYRAQAERREAALVHNAAFQLIASLRGPRPADAPFARDEHQRRAARVELSMASPLRPGELRLDTAEDELLHVLAEQDVSVSQVVIVQRPLRTDAVALQRLRHRAAGFAPRERRLPEAVREGRVMVAAIRRADDPAWRVARVLVPPGERLMLMTIAGQTLLIYLVLVGAIAFILRRITRPIAALTSRLETFARKPSPTGQLAPEGPDDIRRLIEAHNAMEGRIASLLDEKDVMLGAIGHDLKTPLAALRVRIESVDNEAERARMAATIEDIAGSLDDMLSLARVGRPSDPLERSELSALVGSVVDEFEDMGEPVAVVASERVSLPLRATWLRRALRNLIGNALRYGTRARVSVGREGQFAVVRISDDGPGIPPEQIAAMLEPFTRGDPSRNTETGGAGLGLTLARAIAEQHGGALTLANRIGPGGVEGLDARLSLPLT